MPTNIFADLAGTRQTSVIGIVVFAVLLGLAVLSLRKDNPELGDRVLQRHRSAAGRWSCAWCGW